MKKRSALLFLGFLFILASLFLKLLRNEGPTEVSSTQPVVATGTFDGQTPTFFEAVVSPTEVQPTQVPLLVDRFLINNIVDLSSGRSTAMSIYLPNGNQLPVPTWASAISSDTNPISDFDAHAGTVYALENGGVTVWLVHSGMVYNSPDKLFGSNIDRYLTHEPVEKDGILSFLQGSRLYETSEGVAKLSELIGSTAYICQADNIDPFIVFVAECPGELVQLRITAAALITRSQADQYDWTIAHGEILPWLTDFFPNSGFGQVSPRNGFLLSTCVQQYSDQPDVEGVESYVYNRVSIWFEVVP